MSTQTRLKRAAALIGLSFFTITNSFNAAVAETVATEPVMTTPGATPPVVIAPDAAQKPTQQQLDTRLLSSFNSLDRYIAIRGRRGGYEPKDDPGIADRMKTIRDLLDQGANPNSFIGNGIRMNGATNLTPFHAAIVLSARIGTPDFVAYFIAKGGDVKMKAPDGWGAMDYAISGVLEHNAQGREIFARGRSAFLESLPVLDLVIAAGATFDDAVELQKILEDTPVRGFADLARNDVTTRALLDAGRIDEADFAAFHETRKKREARIRATTSLTAAWIKANGGNLNDYPDALPAGPEPYTVKDGDTLQTLGARFMGVMGATNPTQAARAIAATSKLDANATLAAGDKILIPMQLGRQLGSITLKQPMPLIAIAANLKSAYYDKRASIQQIANELAIMNGLDPARTRDASLVKPGDVLVTAYMADMHLQYKPLTAPTHYRGGRDVALLTIESHDESQHAKDTHRVASNIGFAINPRVDLSQFHSLADTPMNFLSPTAISDALEMILNAAGSPIQDRVVISHSMGFTFENPEAAEKFRQMRDAEGTMGYQMTREVTDRLEQSRPIFISASGNWNPTENRHVQSYALTHSPRAVIVGAVGDYSVPGMAADFMIAPYSSWGADTCADLPSHLGEQMEGTSFATPLAAALFRQMNEWYGDILSFEEITAAALMSANRDVLDIPNPDHVNILTSIMTGHTPRTDLAKVKVEKSLYNTNGGGLPNHDRCGAGVLDPQNWQATLNRMVTIKKSLTHQAVDRSYDIRVGTPVIIPGKGDDEKTRYIYRITMPENLTLGKLTFHLPQYKGAHSEIVVRTPAGFEKHLGYTHTDIFSSHAFAYEDVKTGQVIEIMTTAPLGPDAGMILRGHTPGSSIAVLRDHLRAQGVMPAPLREMRGNVVQGPSKSIAPLALRDQPMRAAPGNSPHMPRLPLPPGPVTPPRGPAPE